MVEKRATADKTRQPRQMKNGREKRQCDCTGVVITVYSDKTL